MGLGSSLKKIGKKVISAPLEMTGIPALGEAFKPPPLPDAPDYQSAAEATAAGNLANMQAQTAANRPDEFTPYGSKTWEVDPNDPNRWTSNVNLSPESQGLFDLGQQTQMGLGELGQGAIGRVGEAISDPFSIEGEAPSFQGPGGELGSFGQNRQRVMDAMMSRVGTDIGRDRERKQAQLVAQGIPVGSEAYNREMEQLDRQMTDARQQAEINATQQAGQEYGADILGRQQTGREGMDVFGTGTDARNQAIKEAMLKRSLPLSELSSVMSGSQPMMPEFQPYGQQGAVAGPDYLGAAGAKSQYDLAGYNADVAGQNALMGGLFSLGGAAMMSDIRLKHNIERIGELKSGIPVYNYSYLGEDHTRTGVMAQEVLQVIPDAVIEIGGYYAVDYRKLH